ncbi:hypothetical protein SynBIOSE41_01456 [Synechococcus sp. BIOS-E4-1]|nr:hypothetical protein SynBIOSE41_01456 [Synechococcus sp. BIOS-E4-1]
MSPTDIICGDAEPCFSGYGSDNLVLNCCFDLFLSVASYLQLSDEHLGLIFSRWQKICSVIMTTA